jgi:YD repeat-containing protein
MFPAVVDAQTETTFLVSQRGINHCWQAPLIPPNSGNLCFANEWEACAALSLIPISTSICGQVGWTDGVPFWCYGVCPVNSTYSGICSYAAATCVCDSGYKVNTTQDGCIPICPPGQDNDSVTGMCVMPKNDGPPPCDESAGNPIHLGVGNKYQRDTDRSHSPELVRHYNSDAGEFNGPLGNTWRTSYQSSLLLIPPGSSLTARRADGKRFIFHPAGGGAWVTDANLTDRLAAVSGGGWRYWSTVDGTVEFYDMDGRMTLRAEHSGLAKALAYDSSGRLSTVSDAFGRQLRFAYDGSNRVTGILQPDLTTIQYAYDSHGRLTAVTYPDGHGKRYFYEDSRFPNALTALVDENGDRYATWTYGADGKAIVSEHAGGAERTTLSYGSGASTVTDALGTSRTHGLNTILGVVKSTGVSQPGGSGCGASSSAISYDANGNVSSRTDFNGVRTTYSYDLTRNLETQRTEAVGSAQARTINTAWHPDWRLEAKRAEPKKITTWVYNGQPDSSAGNAIAACAPNSALLPDGKPIAVLCKKVEQATTDATGAAGFAATLTGSPRTWSWTYNGFGQVLTEMDPLGNTTTNTYYADTTADHTLGDLASKTNALGQVTRHTRYDPNGRLLEMSDPNGLVTTLTYSPRGWLTSRNTGGELTTYQYDAVGQLKRTTLPDGSWIGHDYDAAHRLIATYDHLGNRIAYTLDAAGNRTREDVTDPNGVLARTQARVYDALSRVQNVIQPQ